MSSHVQSSRAAMRPVPDWRGRSAPARPLSGRTVAVWNIGSVVLDPEMRGFASDDLAQRRQRRRRVNHSFFLDVDAADSRIAAPERNRRSGVMSGNSAEAK